METQWPLVIFTLFVCLTCGTLGGMSILALKGQGRNLQMTALITSAVSLVVGGIGAFLHLEHWERIFNGFGHITSGHQPRSSSDAWRWPSSSSHGSWSFEAASPLPRRWPGRPSRLPCS